MYDFFISLIPLEIFDDINRISFPAKNAKRSTFFFEYSETPFIPKASVITNPLKSSSSISIFSMMFFDNVEGSIFSFSKDGTFKCAIITDDNPFSINFLKGYSSTSFILFLSKLIVGKVK